MGTRSFLARKTRLDYVNTDPINQFLHGKMFGGLGFLWVFVCNLMLSVFGSIIKYISRYEANKNHEEDKIGNSGQIGSNPFCIFETNKDDKKIKSGENDQVSSKDFPETKSNGFHEKLDDLHVCCSDDEGNEETEDSVAAAASNTSSKYEFFSGKHIIGFVEEPKTLSFTVHEGFVSLVDHPPACNSPVIDNGVLAEDDFGRRELEAGDAINGEKENFVENCAIEEATENQETATEVDTVVQKPEDSVLEHEPESLVHRSINQKVTQEHEKEIDAIVEKKSEEYVQTSVTEKVLKDQKQEIEAEAVLDQKTEDSVQCSVTEELLENQEQEVEVDSVLEPKPEISVESFGIEMDSERQEQETITEHQSCEGNTSSNVIDDGNVEYLEENDSDDDEYIELEPKSQKFSTSNEDIQNSRKALVKQQQENSVHEEPSLRDKQSNQKFDENNDSEFMLEHDDIIEQLKLEIKNAKADARTGGLPTISEDSESPKILPQLKPLKIDQKVEHKDRIAEILKVYKNYSDKMRKLDVLNLQTMHAIGFIQRKTSMQSTAMQKSAVPAFISMFSQNVLSCKPRRAEAVQPLKCSAGLKNDFEMVYVGQLCLSWEILHWQFRKALELREYDCHGVCHYNQVAGGFQLFQVLVQRFLENEPFQGQPRIENYVRNRSVLRSLLQVPVIIDDASRDKKGKHGDEEHAISMAKLTDIIAESMRLFWEFISTDNVTIKGHHHQTQVDLQNPADLQLLTEIRNHIHKKEKKLKEIVRSGSCIVKRFQKHEEVEEGGGGLMLLAQVELKVISRVLIMSKLRRDHLVWCHEKLHKVNFSNKKIVIEPSFLLFPC